MIVNLDNLKERYIKEYCTGSKKLPEGVYCDEPTLSLYSRLLKNKSDIETSMAPLEVLSYFVGTSWTELQLANLVTKKNGCKPFWWLDPHGVFQVVFASVAMHGMGVDFQGVDIIIH